MLHPTHPRRAFAVVSLSVIFASISLIYSIGLSDVNNYQQAIATTATIVFTIAFYKKSIRSFFDAVGRGVYHLGLRKWLVRTFYISLIFLILPILLVVAFYIISLYSGSPDTAFDGSLQILVSYLPLILISAIFTGMYAAPTRRLDDPLKVLFMTPLLLFTAAVLGTLISEIISNSLLLSSVINNPITILEFSSSVWEQVRISAAAAVLVVGIQSLRQSEWKTTEYDREKHRPPAKIPLDSHVNQNFLSDLQDLLRTYEGNIKNQRRVVVRSNEPPYDITKIEPVEEMTEEELLELVDNDTRREWSNAYKEALREISHNRLEKNLSHLEIKVVHEVSESADQWWVSEITTRWRNIVIDKFFESDK